MPRKQRTLAEKIEIINFYNLIKLIKGAKAKTVKNFNLACDILF